VPEAASGDRPSAGSVAPATEPVAVFVTAPDLPGLPRLRAIPHFTRLAGRVPGTPGCAGLFRAHLSAFRGLLFLLDGLFPWLLLRAGVSLPGRRHGRDKQHDRQDECARYVPETDHDSAPLH
jgi:hypothetical protein